MKNVLISYSRSDQVFARRLFERLEQENLESWADWQGIPYSAAWWKEVEKAIEAAQNVVCVLSPAYISSKICNEELAYARSLNKRIIPVIRREFRERGEFLPEIRAALYGKGWAKVAEENFYEVGNLNYIFCRKKKGYDCQYDEVTKKVINPECDGPESDADNFETAFLDLLETTLKDLHYVEEHTRLLTRAREWEVGKYSSKLLRGDDLIAAEAWLTGSEGKSPFPNKLHREYIAESRSDEDEKARQAEEDRRRIEKLGKSTRLFRNTATVLAAIGILAGIATVNALNQSVIAVQNQFNAQTQIANVNAAGTQFALQQRRAATLAASGVIMEPSSTQVAEVFLATLTQIAKLNTWEPVVEEFNDRVVEMVHVPPGCFIMGSIVEQIEQPAHEICFDNPFWIDRYEVTNEQFELLAGVAAAESLWPDPNRPRTNITWFEAKQFCENQRQAQLPTEAQWEYAARGPDSRAYPWGRAFDKDNVVYFNNSTETADVGEDQRDNGTSWVGAYDMSGNVWEWTSSIYKDYPYDRNDGREDPNDLNSSRMYRGGSFKHADYDLRAAKRGWNEPDHSTEDVGFRCVHSQ